MVLDILKRLKSKKSIFLKKHLYQTPNLAKYLMAKESWTIRESYNVQR